MPDFYLQNPEELKGKPKATISDYVEQNGILVPRRYTTLEDALKSGVPIIARSELPQDYDGASGLFHSPIILQVGKITEDEIKRKYLSNQESLYIHYCSAFGIDRIMLLDDLSFSFWEKFPAQI